MAKVYSWSLGQGQYAYIANPNNLDTIYIGTELTVSSALQKVSNWAQTCTDEEYIEHFNQMVQEIEFQGLDVEFESVESYLNAPAVCDNLRGPAGRGISEISWLSADTIANASIYKILYTDGTYGTFKVYNGQNGAPGRDGKDGADGDMGISTRTVFAFTSGKNKEVTKPEGGEWNYITGKVIYPSGWGPNDNIEGPVYQSTRTFASVSSAQDSEWSEPMLISGEDGAPGADGLSVEFLYYRQEKMPPSTADYPDTSELLSPNTPDYQPGGGWVDSPQGVDENWEVEFVTSRKKKGDVWGPWSPASIWSHYGANGQDGDGIQYIYLLDMGKKTILNPTPIDWEINETYQDKDNEWIPSIGDKYYNLDGKPIEINDDYKWTDNPCGVTSDHQFEWVAQRKFRKGEDGIQRWQPFSEPTLWAKYGEDGSNGTSVRTLYWCTDSTGAVPPKPNHSVTNPGGEWQTGFPTKYDFTSNGSVVWGITAVIYSHNNEFVEKYMMVSTKDDNGNVIPPSDYQDNFKDVESLPANKIDTHVKYIRYNGDYYEWTGGWDGPFLVTGVKGADGQAMDYSTIAFCYAPKDYPPQAPNTGVTTGQIENGDVTSEDANGNIWSWYDFPKPELGLDGEENADGIIMRWYQCAGTVDSLLHTVKRWAAVVPNTPLDGETLPGQYMEFRFAVTNDDKEPTIYSQVDEYGKILRYPKAYKNNDPQNVAIGWFTTSGTDSEGNKLPAMTSGCTMWQIWNWIDGATNEVKDEQLWQGPTRISGEKGDKGDTGPIGKRGVTGIPGANYNQMYCLGSETNPYGSEEYKNTYGPTASGVKYGPTKPNFRTWFTSPPSSVAIKVSSENESEIDKYLISTNVGRVIRQLVKQVENNNGSATIKVVKDVTYLIEYEDSKKEKIVKTVIDNNRLEKDEEGDLHLYVWCVQGSDVWSAGRHKGYVKCENGKPEDATDENTFTEDTFPTKENELKKYLLYNNEYYTWTEIDGDAVEHEYLGIEWSEPFRIQGVSGLRGISGSRGQVVYPMGVYNENEVYITTEDKAPYVYDSSDGMFYVLNRVNEPWVGTLPQDYQEITLGNDANGNPIYKYKYNGNWIDDQEGDRPSKNYANNTDAGSAPAWVRFESFEALYTNIGIIENGMIGSAVYNNEFMFSQQGIDRSGAITNYAAESAKPPINSGFLSSYEWDETGEVVNGKQTGKHWKYRGTNQWIADEDVNPYELKSDTNKNYLTDSTLKNASVGTPIHTFRPNVCINFKTGEMWTSAGKVNFDADGSGYLLDGNILWDYIEDKNKNKVPHFQIGEAGSNGISFSGGSMTIGLLDEYKKDVNKSLSGLTVDIATLQTQVDKKSDCYYGPNDPSKNWQTQNSAQTATYANYHLGDLWYSTTNDKSYTFSNETGSTISTGNTASYINSQLSGYYWRESNVPKGVFDRLDGKSSIFVAKPSSDTDNDGYLYHKGDLWLSGNTNGGDGEIMRAIQDCPATSSFNNNHWVKASKYTDDTEALKAVNRLNGISDDKYVSPEEQKQLKQEKATIEKEKLKLVEMAEEYGLTATANTYYSIYDAYNTWYDRAVATLAYYTDSGNYKEKTDTGNTYYKCIEIVSNETGTTGTYFGNISQYYSAKQDLQNAFIKQADDKLSAAIQDKTFLEGVFGNVLDNDGATLTGYLGVKDSNDNIIAYMDGSGIVTDDNGKLVLATGIPVQSGKTLEERAKLAKTKIYDTGLVETKDATLNGTLNSTWAQIGNLKVLGHTLTQYSSDSGNFVVKTGNGSSNADGFGFDSIKNNIRYSYSIGDYGPVYQGDTTSIGFDENGNQISDVTYNTSMVFAKGAQFAMVNKGYDFDTFPEGKYFTPTYTALRVICDVGSTSKHSYAIGCPHGMYAGLRPCIEYWTGSNTLDIFAHTVIINSSSEVTITLPSNPPNGQEYVFLCIQKNNITINGNGKEIFVMNENNTKKEDSFSSKNLRRITLTYCSDYGKWIEIYEHYS